MERECPVCLYRKDADSRYTPELDKKPSVSWETKGDIPLYQHDFDGGYKPEDRLARIASYVEGTKRSIWDYPYQGGIEELRTTLICTLNAISELVTYLERMRIDTPEKALHMIVECKDYIRRCDRGTTD